MQEGSFRCDANVSVRRPGAPLGTRREIKNLNSFKFMQQAIEYEVRWQIERLQDGYAIEQATVLFDPDSGQTRAMRSKEDAADYRYFPDPDLPPLCIAAQWIEQLRAELPELPRAMAERFVADYGLPEYDAATLTQSPQMAAYFEAVVAAAGKALAKSASNWIMGEVSRRLNAEERDIAQAPVRAALLAALLTRIGDQTVSNNAAKQVFDELWSNPVVTGSGSATESGSDTAVGTGDLAQVDQVIAAKGLKQMSDSGALQAIAEQVLAANAKNVAEYRAGKEKAFNALVGQVMKASLGKADPARVNALLKQLLGA
jgi:aspartyl-tRNA(Asn)/glutamyl-tRNA(Gln) amidotransferase subunit B